MKKRWKVLLSAVLLSLQMILAQATCGAVMAEETEQTGQEQQTQENTLAAPSVTGALHVEGTHLMGSNGEQVQLRGASTHGLAWFPQYVNEEWFRQLHDEWRANVVRLAMYTAESGGYCTDGDKDALKVLVKQGVQFATACDMYVIVDWHILSDLNPNVYIDEAKEFFAEMSNEFKEQDNVLYEICNEPNGGTDWPAIKAYAEQVIPVIRQNDEDAVIIVGTPNWSQFVDEAAADPITDQDNIMYTLHYYAATHKDDLRNRMVSAIDAGLPIFVTEYGICDASGNGALDIDQANQWIDTLDQYGVSYVAWNMANKDESSSIFQSSCGKTSGFTVDDLSESGKWLRDMLIAHAPGGEENAGADGTGQQADSSAGSGQQSGSDTAGQDGNADQSSEDSGDAGQNAAESGDGDNTSDGANGSGGTDVSGVITFTDGDIEASAVLRGNWEENGAPTYQYDLTIKNKGQTDCSSWEIDVPFDGEVKLSNGWNGNYTAEGNTLHITSVDYNGTIPAGSSIRDVGFIVSGAQIAADTANAGDSGEESADAQDAGDGENADGQDGAGNDAGQENSQEDSKWI